MAADLLRVVDPERLERLVAEHEEHAKNAKEAQIPRITSASELTQMLHHVYGIELHNDDLDPDDIELVGGFQKELCDWSDIWRDLDPLDHAHATAHLGERLTGLSDAGWSVYAKVELRRMDSSDSREWPVAIVVIARGEPSTAFSIDGITGVVRTDEEN